MSPDPSPLDSRDPVHAQFAGQRCVVTGGLGFIGSNVVRHLVASDADVIVIDSLVPQHGGQRDNVPGEVEVVLADIGGSAIADVLEGADVIFNVAGQVSHHESMVDPMRDLDLNVRSHLQFLESIRRAAPAARIVQTSTRQVYGRPRYLPVDELHPTEPVDVNGVDKLACEQLHNVYARVHGLRCTSLRLTNVYGPRQHLDRRGLGFLPVFIRSALDGDEIRLFGDGSQLRDCLHVDDVVDALMRSVMCANSTGEVFNLGHTDALSLARIAELTIDAAASTSTVRCVEWPEELARIDIGSFHGDFSKAERVLGWKPQIAFAEGIRSTIAHYRALA
jgi:UDP-glucose 4-epimerase